MRIECCKVWKPFYICNHGILYVWYERIAFWQARSRYRFIKCRVEPELEKIHLLVSVNWLQNAIHAVTWTLMAYFPSFVNCLPNKHFGMNTCGVDLAVPLRTYINTKQLSLRFYYKKTANFHRSFDKSKLNTDMTWHLDNIESDKIPNRCRRPAC